MKELSTEQKARRYDEAIERARDVYTYYCDDREQLRKIESIFPELKESEDERIRKELLDFYKNRAEYYPNDPKYKNISAWIAWLEKQGEQKPADKVEPKFKVKYAGSEYNVFEIKDIAGVTFYGIEDEPNHIDYVKAENCEIISGYAIKENGSPYPTKPVVFSEKSHAWSEEDETALGDALWCCKQAASIAKNENDMGNVWYAETWLKFLKDRIQPKQEWSEQEQVKINRIVACLENLNVADNDILLKDVNWLKSLRPQSHWKPSDKQMLALRRVISGCSYDIEPLVEMEEQLKKLREEVE